MSEQGVDYELIEGCRSCGCASLDLVLDLGEMPLSDALVPGGSDRGSESLYPLTLVRCVECSLIQILETVDPKVLYGGDYPYFSSFSDALVEHARSNVAGILSRKPLGPESLVVEIASNDGYLLQWFAAEGIPVLGVDPASGPAAAAIGRGIPTIQDFFDVELARRLVEEGRRADVIVGNNVLAHVPDQNHLVEAMAALLGPGGIVVMEFPYVADLIEKVEFDTIYHEHHCYFSVTTVMRLFRRHGLGLVSVEHLDIHGGSLRVWFEKDKAPDQSVIEFLDNEERLGMAGAGYYHDFALRVAAVRRELAELLGNLKSGGARIAAYGAAAKGTILLNYCDIDERVLDYVVDRNVHKHGWEMPGKRIAIHPTDLLATEPPDYLLLLAWNFKDEIVRQQSAFAERGGRFIVPVPAPEIL